MSVKRSPFCKMRLRLKFILADAALLAIIKFQKLSRLNIRQRHGESPLYSTPPSINILAKIWDRIEVMKKIETLLKFWFLLKVFFLRKWRCTNYITKQTNKIYSLNLKQAIWLWYKYIDRGL